jgi:hypothetical protein
MKERFSFGRPSVGEELLRRSTRLKLDLHRWQEDDDEPAATYCNFELHGTFCVDGGDDPLAADTVALLSDLLHAFRTCERSGHGE